MLKLQYTNKFEKDLKRVQKQGNKKGIKECELVISKLQNGETLDPKYKDHKLNKNEFVEEGSRCCHLLFDLLFVYVIKDNVLVCSQIGDHHSLKGFKESFNESIESIDLTKYIDKDGHCELPNSVTSINQFAFYENKELKSITIPNGVTKIEERTFYNCQNLKTITIPNSVTTIEKWAFYYCTSLTSIIIPDSVKNIGDFAFSNCTSLASIKISDTVTSIGENAFSNCRSLTSITIPDSVTSIGKSAFSCDTSLSGVVIGNNVKKIDRYMFEDCENLYLIVCNSETIIDELMNEYPNLNIVFGFPDTQTYTLEESKKKQVSKEQVLNLLDKTFGQKELYMWSTYVLPNGHFLNPDNPNANEYWDEQDCSPDYEHSDFIYFDYNSYGETVFDDCVKMNVTYPYLILPKKLTIEQQNAIKEIIRNSNGALGFIYGGDYNEWLGKELPRDVKKPLLLDAPFGTAVVDLAEVDEYSLIKLINKAYIQGFIDKDVDGLYEGLNSKNQIKIKKELEESTQDDYIIGYRSINYYELNKLLNNETIYGNYNISNEKQVKVNGNINTNVVCFYKDEHYWRDSQHYHFIKCKFKKSDIVGYGDGTYYASKNLGKVWSGRRGSVEYHIDEFYVEKYSIDNVESIMYFDYSNDYDIHPVFGKYNKQTQQQLLDKCNKLGIKFEKINESLKEDLSQEVKKLYHLTKNNVSKLTPSIPKSDYEEQETPRVCFSDSIQGCLIGINEDKDATGEIYRVYSLETNNYYKPSKEEVNDVNITNEYWITYECEPKYEYTIEVIGIKNYKTYKLNDNEVEVPIYSFRKINTVNESLNEETKTTYHGTQWIFKDFRELNLIWSTPNKKYAKTYGNNILECEIEYNNPVYIGEINIYLNEGDDWELYNYAGINYWVSSDLRELANKLSNKTYDSDYILDELLEIFEGEGGSTYLDSDGNREMADTMPIITNSYMFRGLIRILGYDCVIAYEDGVETYGVVSKNQIKIKKKLDESSNESPTYLYRGTSERSFSKNHKPVSGLFFSISRKYVTGWGNVKRYTLDKTAKIYEGESSDDYCFKNNLYDKEYPEFKEYFGMYGDITRLEQFTDLSYEKRQELEKKVEEYAGNQFCWYDYWTWCLQLATKLDLESKGYDGAKWEHEDFGNPVQYQIWNLDKIKSSDGVVEDYLTEGGQEHKFDNDIHTDIEWDEYGGHLICWQGDEWIDNNDKIIEDNLRGMIDFDIDEDKHIIYIGMIQTSIQHRREGIATLMMNDLQKRYQGNKLNLGFTTDDGTKFFNNYLKNNNVKTIKDDINENDNEKNLAQSKSKLKSAGIYSIKKNKWIKKPILADIPKIDKEELDKQFKVWEDRFFEIQENPTIESIDKYLDDIYAIRQEGIEESGEYNLKNLCFKEARNLGFLDALKELKDELVSKELSLESLNESDKDYFGAIVTTAFCKFLDSIDRGAFYKRVDDNKVVIKAQYAKTSITITFENDGVIDVDAYLEPIRSRSSDIYEKGNGCHQFFSYQDFVNFIYDNLECTWITSSYFNSKDVDRKEYLDLFSKLYNDNEFKSNEVYFKLDENMKLIEGARNFRSSDVFPDFILNCYDDYYAKEEFNQDVIDKYRDEHSDDDNDEDEILDDDDIIDILFGGNDIDEYYDAFGDWIEERCPHSMDYEEGQDYLDSAVEWLKKEFNKVDIKYSENSDVDIDDEMIDYYRDYGASFEDIANGISWEPGYYEGAQIVFNNGDDEGYISELCNLYGFDIVGYTFEDIFNRFKQEFSYWKDVDTNIKELPKPKVDTFSLDDVESE